MLKREGKVDGVFLNPLENNGSRRSVPQSVITAIVGHGIAYDRHSGPNKKESARDREVYNIPRIGTKDNKAEVANWRHWTAVSLEEVSVIAERLRLTDADPKLMAELLGANLLIRGIENFTQVARTSIIEFSSGAWLKVEAENFPCIYPGMEIQNVFNHVDPKEFRTAAMHLRGLVGTVYVEGDISTGDAVTLYEYEPSVD
jgi:MOSC domain-containing protein YiiM